MNDEQLTISEIEGRASAAAEKGETSEVLKIMDTPDIPLDVRDRLDDSLLKAVEVAVENSNITEAIEAIGAQSVPEEVQRCSVDIIAKARRASWLGGIFGFRDVPDSVGMKILEELAEAGQMTELIRIAQGKKITDYEHENDIPEALQEKAKEVLPRCIDVRGEEGIISLPIAEMQGIMRIFFTKEKKPLLHVDGVLSEGTVKGPAKAKEGPGKKTLKSR